MRNYYIFLIILGVVVIISLAVGFAIVGNPIDQRDKQIDDNRSSAISSISNEISNYYSTNKNTLPKSLNDIAGNITHINEMDVYKYTIINKTHYKLCTTFKVDTTNLPRDNYTVTTAPLSGLVDFYKHPKGYYCFNEDVTNLIIPTPASYNAD